MESTTYVQEVSNLWDTVAQWRNSGQKIEDSWLARMGPVHFAHVNFRGTFKFGASRYAEMFLSQSSTPARKVA